mgnify:CR=1 FL=1
MTQRVNSLALALARARGAWESYEARPAGWVELRRALMSLWVLRPFGTPKALEARLEAALEEEHVCTRQKHAADGSDCTREAWCVFPRLSLRALGKLLGDLEEAWKGGHDERA